MNRIANLKLVSEAFTLAALALKEAQGCSFISNADGQRYALYAQSNAADCERVAHELGAHVNLSVHDVTDSEQESRQSKIERVFAECELLYRRAIKQAMRAHDTV